MPVECLGRDAQWGMERAFKGLLAAGVNDTIKFCRDAAVMWRHMESTLPITDRRGAKAAKALLEATRGPEWHGCTLTRFTEAYRRGDIVPDPTEQEREALRPLLGADSQRSDR